jgi:hypothetical protein
MMGLHTSFKFHSDVSIIVVYEINWVKNRQQDKECTNFIIHVIITRLIHTVYNSKRSKMAESCIQPNKDQWLGFLGKRVGTTCRKVQKKRYKGNICYLVMQMKFPR